MGWSTGGNIGGGSDIGKGGGGAKCGGRAKGGGGCAAATVEKVGASGRSARVRVHYNAHLPVLSL